MSRRLSWDDWALGLAAAVAARGSCRRRQVGCVLLGPRNDVVSVGYNGAPAGERDCLEDGCLSVSGYCERTVHAEQNALLWADASRLVGATAYVTCQPCHRCDLLLRQAGVQRVVWPAGATYSDRVRKEL